MCPDPVQRIETQFYINRGCAIVDCACVVFVIQEFHSPRLVRRARGPRCYVVGVFMSRCVGVLAWWCLLECVLVCRVVGVCSVLACLFGVLGNTVFSSLGRRRGMLCEHRRAH